MSEDYKKRGTENPTGNKDSPGLPCLNGSPVCMGGGGYSVLTTGSSAGQVGPWVTGFGLGE